MMSFRSHTPIVTLALALAVLPAAAQNTALPISVESPPRILRVVTSPPFSGLSVPTYVDAVAQTDLVDAVVTIANTSATPLSNVVATLTPASGTGVEVLTNPVNFGYLGAGVSAPGTFRIRTTDAKIGIHELRVSVSHSGGTQDELIWMPVWKLESTLIDVPTGRYSGVVEGCFTSDAILGTAPEILDAQGVPSYFDLQSFTIDRTFKEPFFGTHWGESHVSVSMARIAGLAGGNFDLCIEVTDRNGVRIPATITIQLPDGTIMSQHAPNGVWCPPTLPTGHYRICETPDDTRFYQTTWWEGDFTGGFPTLTFKYPRTPVIFVPGGTGTTRPPAPATGGPNVNKTTLVGGLSGMSLILLDIALGLETAGIALASAAGSLFGAGASGAAADPIESDVFWAGEANTTPASTSELTLSESVSMKFTMIQPPVGEQNLIIRSVFDFTRTTDAATYTWSTSEILDVPLYLHLGASASLTRGPAGSRVALVETRVQTPDGRALKGSEAKGVAYLCKQNDFSILGMVVLHDDGQKGDRTANDGLFSGTFALPANPDFPYDISVWATRVGFELDLIPGHMGMVWVSVGP